MAQLAMALVLHAEVIQKIKNLAKPKYQRLTVPDLNARLAAIHVLCLAAELTFEERDADANQATDQQILDGHREQRP